MDAKQSPTEKPGCLGYIMQRLGFATKNKAREELPYRLRDDFVSPAELSLFHVLRQMTGKSQIVLTKVNLADVFYVVRLNENMAYRNKIDRKHVDFLICDPKTLKPTLGVELDDRSHQRKARVERDAFVDKVFQVAGLPLVRVTAAQSYSTTELGALFREALMGNIKPEAAPISGENIVESVDASDAATPVCPSCGVPMILREVKRGAHAGKKFYGCANFPKCREMIPLEE